MGRREKRGCCRKREQIIYKVLKWRGEYSVIRKQNLDCGELGVRRWGGRLGDEQAHSFCTQRYAPVMTRAPGLLCSVAPNFTCSLVKDSEMLVKHLSAYVRAHTHTHTHIPTLYKMSCPLNCLQFFYSHFPGAPHLEFFGRHRICPTPTPYQTLI